MCTCKLFSVSDVYHSLYNSQLYIISNFVQQLSPLQTNWLYMMKTAAAHIQQNSNHREKVEVPPCEPDIDSLHYSCWLSTILLVCWICTLRNWECNFCAICAVFLMSLGHWPWPSIMAICVPHCIELWKGLLCSTKPAGIRRWGGALCE